MKLLTYLCIGGQLLTSNDLHLPHMSGALSVVKLMFYNLRKISFIRATGDVVGDDLVCFPTALRKMKRKLHAIIKLNQ